MTKQEKLKKVLERLENEKGWSLFNSLTNQGKKLVEDTIELAEQERVHEIATDEVKRDPQRFLVWVAVKLVKYIIFLTGVYTILKELYSI